VAVTALAVLASFGLDGPGVREVEEGGEALVAHDDDVAAAAAVTPRRAAERNVFFAPEGDGAVSAAPSDDFDPTFVDESHGRL
jgi:hypothetical protein